MHDTIEKAIDFNL